MTCFFLNTYSNLMGYMHISMGTSVQLQLEQAEAYLRAAGIDLPFDASRKEEKKKKKRRKKEKEKDKKSKKQHNCLSQP